jgi:hypothetical protein
MGSRTDSFLAGVLQSRTRDIAKRKKVKYGSKNKALLNGILQRFGGYMVDMGSGRYVIEFRGELHQALLHALEPVLNGKKDETEWARGYLADGVYFGKREASIHRTKDPDIIARLIQVLQHQFPTMQLHGGTEQGGVGVYRKTDIESLRQWLHQEALEEDTAAWDVEKGNVHASRTSSLSLLNDYRRHKGTGQKFAPIAPGIKDNLIMDLQRTHPLLDYKYLCSKYGCSAAQIGYLVKMERKKGTVFPVRRGDGVSDPKVQKYIESTFDKIVQNPQNKNGLYAKCIQHGVKREFGLDVPIPTIRRVAKAPWV